MRRKARSSARPDQISANQIAKDRLKSESIISSVDATVSSVQGPSNRHACTADKTVHCEEGVRGEKVERSLPYVNLK
jgi:hypothetical protein